MPAAASLPPAANIIAMSLPPPLLVSPWTIVVVDCRCRHGPLLLLLSSCSTCLAVDAGLFIVVCATAVVAVAVVVVVVMVDGKELTCQQQDGSADDNDNALDDDGATPVDHDDGVCQRQQDSGVHDALDKATMTTERCPSTRRQHWATSTDIDSDSKTNHTSAAANNDNDSERPRRLLGWRAM
ncbi:hypothetical protein EDB89DRAFT_1908383 [Lactarius sanguifluus]|nr:hypothetical protein EDB89DRAFT_1908383 [Lactarius sanguifluus]